MSKWVMRAYYGPEANRLWRRKHPKSRHPGPQEGEVAIEVQGPKSVVDIDASVAEARPDIGRVYVGEAPRRFR